MIGNAGAIDDFFIVGDALVGEAVTGIFQHNGHLYCAAGASGIRDVDVTNPGNPVDLGDISAGTDEPLTNAVDVVVSVLPTQTWVLGTDNNGALVDLVAYKLDRTQSTRERCLPDPSICKQDMDWRDPTIMGRDATFINGAFDVNEPDGDPAFRIAGTRVTAGGRLARPSFWDQIGTPTGRRVRDSFMPGSGVLSQTLIQRMYFMQVCEIPGTEDINGSGWGEFGIADGDFFSTGECQPITEPLSGDGGEMARVSLVCGSGSSFCFGTDEDVPRVQRKRRRAPVDRRDDPGATSADDRATIRKPPELSRR